MRIHDYIYLNRDKITFPSGAESFVIDCNLNDSNYFITYGTGWVLTDVIGDCDYPGKVCITRNDFDRIIATQDKKIARRNKIRKLFGLKDKI
ncbi:hypothetical protein [Enterobacter ludwigii]|uniref:Uncharacterized protein n=1 Tax=Enterobacter ludwigii TaxID=299767 RepID=A0AAX3LFB7_9ENTR|nr:hypothetical protein [Enterobacter ludwigii]KUQ43260.1 hypothetical protein AWI16_14925 [Enterobacter ludwigii]MBX8912058.1 hypothetical protein [Enterobacter ludwigii]MCM7782224.1 hypothetical protein [Enterobacter ludwigii]MDH1545656.1 hypothetical protein [Enterobacter ludwigii]RTO53309.1 hypothetical protein EKN74_09035 [Enterobacter ludwigii]